MNYQEFLSALAKLGQGKFTVTSSQGLIRTNDDAKQCPISFLCEQITGKHFHNMNYTVAAEWLGIDDRITRDRIVNAADNYLTTGIRQDLLDSLNLTEVK